MKKNINAKKLIIFTLLFFNIPNESFAKKNNNPGLMQALSFNMDYSLKRHKILSQNIAAVNVPGYKAKDLEPFNLKKIKPRMSNNAIRLKVTSGKHINSKGFNNSSFKTIKMKDTYETSPNGNNVSLEEQMALVSENSVDYNLTTAMYKKWANLIKLAATNK